MSKISKMKMKDIIDRESVILKGANQIIYCWNDMDSIDEIYKLAEKSNDDTSAMCKFLIDNDERIDKERFLLVIIKNHLEVMENLNNRIKKIKTELSEKTEINEEEKIRSKKESEKLREGKKREEEYLRRLKKLGKDIDLVFHTYYFNEKEQQYAIRIFDSEILIKGRRREGRKQLEKFYNIDKEFSKGTTEKRDCGIEAVVENIFLTDFYAIFDDEDFGDTLRTLIIDNGIINSKIKTKEELEHLRENDDKEYDRVAQNLDFESIVTYLRDRIEEYIDYLDLDKLLLVAAYRIEEGLEDGIIDPKIHKGDYELLKVIFDNLEGNNKEYVLDNIQARKNGKYIPRKIKYSRKDIEDCLKRFTENSYLTKREIQEKRSNILGENLNISDLEYDEIGVIFSDEELNKLDSLTDNDFAYLSEKLNWDRQTILAKMAKNKKGCSKDIIEYFIDLQRIEYKDVINLYLNQTINIEQLEDICEKIDVSELLNSYELIEYYSHSIQKESTEEEKEKYNRYVNLCKKYIMADEEKSKQFSEDLMEKLIENYDPNNERPFVDQLEEFFKQEILPLNIIIELKDENITKKFISDMYSKGIIDLEKIKELVSSNILKFEYFQELVYTEGMEHSKVLEILNQGFIDKESIFKLFAKNIISKDDLINLANKDIIDSEEVNKILGINKDETITDDQYILLISGALQKIKTVGGGKYKSGGPRYNKKVIDPDKRLELFELLGARKYEAVLPKSSPFYNYDFFVIPGKDGDYKNGIIIAERIYEEKPEHLSEDEEIKFATDNATYIFENIEDIKVIERSEKHNKTEAIKKKNGIIKRVNHVLADGRKNGRWAFDLRDAIVKIMIRSDLKEYSKANQSTIINQKLREVYGIDTWMKITNKAAEIDCSSDHRMIDDDDDAR